MTDCEGSKIDNGKWTTWVYPWGEGVPQAEVPQGIGALIAAELLDQQEGYEALADMYEGLKQMDALLPAAREKVNAELGDRFAELCQQHKFFYILGSGPNFSQTYAMAICSLMEMQWQHCCYIHSGEYFHGPFEATEPGVFYFVQLGSGECRPWRSVRWRSSIRTPIRSWCLMHSSTAWARCLPACVRTWSRSSSTT